VTPDISDPYFETEIVPTVALAPHPQNYRKHPRSQIEHIAASIEQHGFYRPIVAARDLTILAGHGLVLAANSLGYATVPVVRLDLDALEPRALKILAGDNEIARLAVDDGEILAAILRIVEEEDSLLGTGYDEEALDALREFAERERGTEGESEEEDTTYSRAIESPVYQPTGRCPDVLELVDYTKTLALIERIDSADLPENVKVFLRSAASRHAVFDYAKIAEFYAHVVPELQALMEESALVIVDVDRAIELGFAKLMSDLREIAAEEAEADAV
jgi:hypothetical protein